MFVEKSQRPNYLIEREKLDSVVILLTGPNTAGKGTLTTEIVQNPQYNAEKVKRHTTRPIGINEKNGDSYFFVNNLIFEDMIKEGKFVQWDKFLPGYYGTTFESLLEPLKKSKNGVIDLGVDEALAVREYLISNGFGVIDVFMIPILHEELMGKNGIEKALSVVKRRTITRARGFDLAPEELEDRLSYARSWLERIGEFNYIIENPDGNVDLAFTQMRKIHKDFIQK